MSLNFYFTELNEMQDRRAISSGPYYISRDPRLESGNHIRTEEVYYKGIKFIVDINRFGRVIDAEMRPYNDRPETCREPLRTQCVAVEEIKRRHILLFLVHIDKEGHYRGASPMPYVQ